MPVAVEGLLNAAHTRVFDQIVAAYKAAEEVPPIILLDEAGGRLSALEGHARLTALALARLDGPLPFERIGVIVSYTSEQRRSHGDPLDT